MPAFWIPDNRLGFHKNLNIKIYFIGREELFDVSLSRYFHEAVGTINLNYSKDKGKSALKTAITYLKSGKVVAIFPEGRRTENGRLSKGKVGISKLVLEAKVQVLPMAIKGTYKLFPATKLISKFKKKSNFKHWRINVF